MDEDLNHLVKRIKSSIDMWMAFLTRNDLLDQAHLPENLSDDKLRKALNALDVINFSYIERDIYEGRLKWIRLKESVMQKRFEDFREKGRKEGIEEGVEKIAIKMLEQNLDIQLIYSVTGLSSDQITQLKSRL